MSEKSPDNRPFELGASRWLAAVMVVLHAGAGLLAAALPLTVAARVVLVAALALSLAVALRRHVLRLSGDSVVALELNDAGGCALRRRASAEWEEGRLVGWWVQRFLVIIAVRREGRRWSTGVAVAADAMTAEAFRRLRVRLRLRPAAARGSYRAARSQDRERGSPA